MVCARRVPFAQGDRRAWSHPESVRSSFRRWSASANRPRPRRAGYVTHCIVAVLFHEARLLAPDYALRRPPCAAARELPVVLGTGKPPAALGGRTWKESICLRDVGQANHDAHGRRAAGGAIQALSRTSIS